MDQEPILDPEADMVEMIVQFAQYLEKSRSRNNPVAIQDRDRFIATIMVSLLSDPNHFVGYSVTRRLLRLWVSRGGRLPIRGNLARQMVEPDQFHFTAQYLYDYGMPIKEIAMALACDTRTIEAKIITGASNEPA